MAEDDNMKPVQVSALSRFRLVLLIGLWVILGLVAAAGVLLAAS